MTDLVLHELTGSPNNVKVRIGLGYKGLEYERRPIDLDGFPGNRAAIVAISRQPRTPVLQHGKTVIYDSGGILRYLDANFPQTPTLFSADYQTMGKIEELELWARTDLGQPIGMIFGQVFAPEQDPEVGVRASGMLNDLTARVEESLESNAFLLGPTPTGADLAVASLLNLSALSEKAAAKNPIASVFRKMLQLGPGRDRTRAWVAKLLEYDAAQRA
jgi:glutathione S-transferase